MATRSAWRDSSSGATSAFFSPKSTRLLVACLMCYSVAALALMRTNLAVALVCMVNSSAVYELDGGRLPDDSFNRSQHSATRGNSHSCQLAADAQNEYNGELIWTSTQISFIFSAIFWGGLLTGIFSGWLADRYGPKNILLVACIIHVLGSFLTPVVAVHTGFYGMIVTRFIMGLGQGVTIPCMGALIARWFPSEERSTVIAIYTTGNQLGTMIANPVGAYLCGAHWFLGGWPAIFYVFGTIGVVWCICWSLLVSNSPEKNKRISNNELLYLQRHLKSQSLQNRKTATKSVPWGKMFRSGPILAQVTMNAAAACFMTVYQSYMPTYFMQVLALNLKQNGLLSALPYIVQMVVKMIVSRLSDWMKKRDTKINETTLCKIFNSIAAFGTAISLVAMSFMDCQHVTLAVFLTCMSFAGFANFAPGFLTSQISIAPVYSGIVSSFSRVCAQFGQIAAPAMVGYFVVEGTRREWQHVQLLLAGFLTFGGVIFLIFGSADIQPWALAPMESHLPLATSKNKVTLAEDEIEVNASPAH